MSTLYRTCERCGSHGGVWPDEYCPICHTKQSVKDPTWYQDITTIPLLGPVLRYTGYGLSTTLIVAAVLLLAVVAPILLLTIVGIAVCYIAGVFVVAHVQSTAPARQAAREKREQEEVQRQAELQEQRAQIKEAELAKIEEVKQDIRAMPRYAVWRQEVFARFGRKCMVCNSTENLEVDHRKSLHALVVEYRIENRVQAYECSALWIVDNGNPLCKECHTQTSNSQHRSHYANSLV